MISIAIYNLKGGVGKTTTAVNLAYLSSQAKKNTVLWDWDPQGAVAWNFGLNTSANSKTIKVFNKGAPLGSVEVKSPFQRLTLIPADLSLRNLDKTLAEKSQARKIVRKLVEPLSENTEIIFFDCPPTLSPSIEALLSAVDLVVVPMIPSPMSLRAAEQVKEFFSGKKYAPDAIMGLFTMVDGRRKVHKDTVAARKQMSLPMFKTVIPADAAAEAMSLRREPLTSYAKSGRAASSYIKLWREIRRHLKSR